MHETLLGLPGVGDRLALAFRLRNDGWVSLSVIFRRKV